jgi:carboxylesterase type B
MSTLEVRTRAGTLAGAMADDKVRVFRGVPYAKPPVGPLRWKPPQPIEPWSGTRMAVEFAPDCPQTLDVGSRAPAYSEDCLYLNVWTPADAEPGSLPVLVWIYGGSFISGSASEARTDGAKLARRGAVVVALNYRVGLFGYLAHPALTKESPQRSSSNYGLLDQVAALQWIRENIAPFGGDPKRVTVFGVSAGSASISLLLASPLGKGLFDRAILHSPGAVRRLASLEDAEQAGRALGDDIGALRQLSGSEILAKTPLLAPKVRGLTTPRVLRPIRDGWVMPEDERPVFKSGRVHPMPVILGTCFDEGTEFVTTWPVKTLAPYRELIDSSFGASASAALDAYPAKTDADVALRLAELFADTQFNYGTRLLAQAMAAKGQPVWRYLFTRRRGHRKDGPHHGQDVHYVFGNLSARYPNEAPEHDATDREISDYIMRAWVEFAATGKAPWQRFDAAADNHIQLNAGFAAGSGWRRRQLDFLDDYFGSLP